MGWSLKIGRIAGAPIRVHWSFLLLLAYCLYWVILALRPGGADPVAVLEANGFLVLCLVVAVLAHECAHAVAARSLGGTTVQVVLWPLGGFTEVSSLPPGSRPRLILALAGPFANLALAGLLQLAPALGFNAPWLAEFAYWNFLLGLWNLIPAQPFDGGEAARVTLAALFGFPRGELAAAWLAAVSGGVILLAGLYWSHWFLIVAGIIVLSVSVRAIRETSWVSWDDGSVRASGKDTRSWRRSRTEIEAEIQRRRERRTLDLEESDRVDRILRQISERGMQSLSDEDRAFLEQASARLRDRTRSRPG